MKDIHLDKILRYTIAAAWAVCCETASAKTVAWYHFEDAANGTRASYSDTLANAVDDSVLPLSLRWITANAKTLNDTDNTTAGQICRPTFEDVIPEGMSWSAGGIIGVRRTGLRLNMNGGSTGSALGFPRVVDDTVTPRLQLQTFTVEFFVRLDPAYSSISELYLLTMRAGNSNYAYRFRIEGSANANKGKMKFQFKNSDGTATADTLSNMTTLLDGKLHHVAFVKSPSGFQIYVDYAVVANNIVDSIGKCTIGYGTEGNTLEIGANSGSDYGRMPCWIDELRISDTALATSSFIGFGERLEDDALLEVDTLVYHDFNTNHVSLSGARVFNNLATAANAPTLSLYTPSGGLAPTLVTDDFYASNLCFAACENIPDTGCWEFSYGDTAGLSSMMSIDDTKLSGGASHQIYDSDSTVEMLVRFPEAPSRQETMWHSQLGTSSHVTYSTRIYSSGGGDIIFSLVSQAQADAHLSDGNPTRIDRTVPGGALDGKWHHLALVNDRRNGKVRCYWDRKLVGDEWSGYLATNAYPAISARSPIRVSGQGPLTPASGDDQSQFKGRIDMLRVTARALTPDEFVRAYKAKRGTLIIFQ